MTSKEARAFLEMIATNLLGDSVSQKDEKLRELMLKEYDAIDMALEALEKQILKKPKHRGVTDGKGVFHPTNGINGVPYDLCPNCETNLCTDGFFGRDKKYIKYCERCGQRLDWSET